MKSSTVGIIAVLLCAILVAPALGVGVNMFLGASGVSTNGFGSGGSVDKISQPNGAQLAITKGLEAHVKIPAGYQGNAWARFSGSNTRATTQTLNGNSYYLQAGYQNAIVNAGARKTVTQGVAASNAMVEAYAAVDNNNLPFPMQGCKKNYLEGWAKIAADTTSSTTGDTYAFASGNAFYTAREICPSCPTPVKEVAGRINGTADVESINKECASCPTCKPPAPTGTKTGSAVIYTTSNANDYKSYSYSTLYTDVSANRGSNSGFSGINATIGGITTAANPVVINGNAQASSYAVDGTSPAGTPSTFNTANVKTNVIDHIWTYATTYAIGDKAAAKTSVTSKAWHEYNPSYDNPNYLKAYNQLYSDARVTRTDMNQLTPARAYTSTLDNPAAKFFAKAQDNQDPDNVYAIEYANIPDTEALAQALTAPGVTLYSTIDFNLEAALQNDGTKTAKINNIVTAKGALTGDDNDFVYADEEFNNAFAQASNGPGDVRSTDKATVQFADKDVDYYVFGASGPVVASPIEPTHGTSSIHGNPVSPAGAVIGVDSIKLPFKITDTRM